MRLPSALPLLLLFLAVVAAVPAIAAGGPAPVTPANATPPEPTPQQLEPMKVQLRGLIKLSALTEEHCRLPLQDVQLRIDTLDTGLRALSCERGRFTFRLLKPNEKVQSAQAAAAWERMLGSPWEDAGNDFVRSLDYTIVYAGREQERVLAAGVLQLELSSPLRTALGLAMVLAVWLALFLLALKSGLLRDTHAVSEVLEDRPFSLARAQIAWWFAIIVGAFVFLWMITGDIPSVSAQALGLLGIAGASGLTAASLDVNKHPVPVQSSGRFFLDLLSDRDGVTVYRLQMLAMTVILGLMFVVHVLTRLSMPEFDGTILTLLGISAGTYVGFKVPEKQVDTPASEGAGAPLDPKSAYQES